MLIVVGMVLWFSGTLTLSGDRGQWAHTELGWGEVCAGAVIVDTLVGYRRCRDSRPHCCDFLFFDVAPGALGVFLRATNAGCKVLQAVHVEATAAVAGWDYALTALELFHASYHF
jgi:hypothetical protein